MPIPSAKLHVAMRHKNTSDGSYVYPDGFESLHGIDFGTPPSTYPYAHEITASLFILYKWSVPVTRVVVDSESTNSLVDLANGDKKEKLWGQRRTFEIEVVPLKVGDPYAETYYDFLTAYQVAPIKELGFYNVQNNHFEILNDASGQFSGNNPSVAGPLTIKVVNAQITHEKNTAYRFITVSLDTATHEAGVGTFVRYPVT